MAQKISFPYHKITTPAGRAVWPHLHAPDDAFGKSEYKTGINLPAEEALPLVKKINAAWKEALEITKREKGKAKKAPYAPYEEQEDGSYTFNFKSQNEPAMFDAAGGKVPSGTRVGGGSILRVAGNVRGYDAPFGVGVTLYLNAVQIIDLQEFGSSDTAEGFGFDTSGEGFSVADMASDDEDDDLPFDEGDSEDDDDFPADF